MYKEHYYIVSDEMRKAVKNRKRNFAIHEELKELAKDIDELKEKYKSNRLAVAALGEFTKILESTDHPEKGKQLISLLKTIARKLETGKAPSATNAVAGTRG